MRAGDHADIHTGDDVLNLSHHGHDILHQDQRNRVEHRTFSLASENLLVPLVALVEDDLENLLHRLATLIHRYVGEEVLEKVGEGDHEIIARVGPDVDTGDDLLVNQGLLHFVRFPT